MTTFVERDDTRIAALIHDASLGGGAAAGRRGHLGGRDRARERAPAGRPAGAAERPAGLAGADRRGRRHRAPQARARPPRRRPAAARLDLDRPARRRRQAARRGARGEAARERPRGAQRVAGGAAQHRARHPPGDPLRPRPAGRAGERWPPARRSASRSTSTSPSARRPQLEVAAYYLIAEGLTNVAKYAEAESAKIAIMRENGSLIVELTDDGKGGADPDGRLRPARARRPRRGARRAPEDLEPTGGRNTTESGDPMRVVLADDTMLLREGRRDAARRGGLRRRRPGRQRRGTDRRRRRAQARGRDRRPADAADAHRRGPAGRAGDPRQASEGRRARALPARRHRARDEAARRRRRGRRLHAQGPRLRPRGLRRRDPPCRRGRLCAGPHDRLPAALQAPRGRARWTTSPHASAKCSS